MNLGMSMTFTLFEWLKEAKDDLLDEQPSMPLPPTTAEVTNEVAQMSVEDQGEVCTSESCLDYRMSCAGLIVLLCVCSSIPVP